MFSTERMEILKYVFIKFSDILCIVHCDSSKSMISFCFGGSRNQ